MDKGIRSNTPLLDFLPPASGRCTADTLLGLAAPDGNPALLGCIDGDCAFLVRGSGQLQFWFVYIVVSNKIWQGTSL
jgi:hypothetical protein